MRPVFTIQSRDYKKSASGDRHRAGKKGRRINHLSITLRHLRAFVVVARHGSFKLAARELARSQPAITLAIQQLEDYIDLKLLERTTRKVTPTLEGERFIPIAERLIRDFDTAILDLNATADRRSGHLRIAVLPSVATQLFPTVIKAFGAQYPGISIDMIDDNSRGIQQRLARNEVDFGIGSSWRSDPELQFQPLLEDRFELICHRDHPLAKRDGPVEWEVLKDYPYLDSGLTAALPDSLRNINAKLKFSTTTTLYSMVRANIGVTVLPTLAVQNDYADLVTRPLARPVVKRSIQLITRKEWTLSPACEALIEVLLEELPAIISQLGLANLKLLQA